MDGFFDAWINNITRKIEYITVSFQQKIHEDLGETATRFADTSVDFLLLS